MATSKATFHVRSSSFPSRSHPLTATVEEQLCRLRSTQGTSSSLNGLKVLHECVNAMLQLPQAQQTLSNEQHNKWVEEVMDGPLHLLDVCGTTRDVLLSMKEILQKLQSSLRRRKGGGYGLASEVDAYIITRKTLSKTIRKCLKNLKSVEMNRTSSSTMDSNTVDFVGMLREVEEISLSIFESLLSLVSYPKARSSPWSIVSKLLKSKRVSCEGEADANEMEKIEVDLLVLKSGKDINLVQVQNVLKGLNALESSIQEAQEELECVYRQLVKTRVSILNILNHEFTIYS